MGFWNWFKKKQVAPASTSTPVAPLPAPEPNVDDLLKRIDVTALYPWFAAKVRLTLTRCRMQSADYYAISGYRSPQEQEALYAEGRTVKVRDGKPVKIVTNARPGRSAHNYGAAVDGCRDADATRAGLQPDWDIEDYALWAEQSRVIGLEAGYFWVNFKEGPHIQMPLKQHYIVGVWDNLYTLYKKGGVPLVWAEFDKHNWDDPKACVECAKYK